MAATARQERELKVKYQNILNKKSDPNVNPLEVLQAYVLSHGVRGFKNIRSYVQLSQLPLQCIH